MMTMRHRACNEAVGIWTGTEPPAKGDSIWPENFIPMSPTQPIGYCARCEVHVPATDENISFHTVHEA